MKLVGTFLVLVPLTALMPLTAFAIATYSYTGNSNGFILNDTPPAGAYTAADAITGSFQVSTALGPSLTFTDISASVLSYSFNDGRNTLTNLDSSINLFQVGTDASAHISNWLIQVSTDFSSFPAIIGEQRFGIGTQNISDFGNIGQCMTLSASGDFCTVSNVDQISVGNNPGQWAVTQVPEPATLALLGIGLAGVTFSHRKKKSKGLGSIN